MAKKAYQILLWSFPLMILSIIAYQLSAFYQPNNTPELLKYAYISLGVFYPIASLIIMILAKKKSRKYRILLLAFLLSPGIIEILTYIYISDFTYYFFISFSGFILPLGISILLFVNLYFISLFFLIIGLTFKFMHLPTANELIFISLFLIIFQAIIGITHALWSKKINRELKTILVFQNIGFTLSAFGILTGLLHLPGQFYVPFYFVPTILISLYTFIFLPKSNFIIWHPDEKKYFRYNLILPLAIFISLFILFGYMNINQLNTFSFKNESLIPHYEINLNTPLDFNK